MANRFNIDYACGGFCSKCHIEIAEFRGFRILPDGSSLPQVVALLPIFRSQLVELSDGTFMNISLCETCFNLKPDDLEAVMASEHKGWEMEVKHHNLDSLCNTWVEGAKDLAIHDVPSMKWDVETKSSIQKGKK